MSVYNLLNSIRRISTIYPNVENLTNFLCQGYSNGAYSIQISHFTLYWLRLGRSYSKYHGVDPSLCQYDHISESIISGGEDPQGRINKHGDEHQRTLLIHDALAAIRHLIEHDYRTEPLGCRIQGTLRVLKRDGALGIQTSPNSPVVAGFRKDH